MASLLARVLFVGLAAVGGVVGGWAEASPGGFYRTFPGFGHHWLPPLGPYNEHLLRDFGALNLGLTVAALVAAVALTRPTAVAVGAAWFVYGVPHLAFHLGHTDIYSTADNVANLTALVLGVVAPAAATGLAWRATRTPAVRSATGRG